MEMSPRENESHDFADAERDRLIEILGAPSDLVSTALPDGRVTYMNSAGRQLVGWSPDDVVIQKRIQDIHPQRVTCIVEDEGIPTAIGTGVWEGETAVLGPNGGEIPVPRSSWPTSRLRGNSSISQRPCATSLSPLLAKKWRAVGVGGG